MQRSHFPLSRREGVEDSESDDDDESEETDESSDDNADVSMLPQQGSV